MHSLMTLLLTPSVWKRRAAYGVGGLFLLWALAWLAVPPLLKNQIEAQGSAALGRKLTLGAIDFKPWSLELTLTDLAIATADGRASQFKVARVYVDAELESIFRLAPVLDSVVVEAPELKLTHTGGGHYDIDDIIRRLSEPSPDPTSVPAHFAFYNLELRDGAVDFTDTPVARQHSLQKLHLTVPFLSNLDAQRDIKVEPRLAFVLNGSVFDTAAQGTPFAQIRKGDGNLKITRLDLTPYLAYLPAGLPVQPKGAVIDADVRVDFVQTPKVALSLSGTVKVSALKLADASGADLLGVESIAATLSDVRPLEQVAKLASLELTGPKLRAVRNRAGALNLDFSPSQSSSSAIKKGATSADSTGATGLNGNKSPVANAWTLELARFALHKGEVSWADDSTQPHARMALTDVELQADSIRWPFAQTPAQFSGSLAVAGKSPAGQLTFEGQGTDQAGKVHATLADFGLVSAAPYVAPYLEPRLRGAMDAELDAVWQADGVQVAVQRLALRDAALQSGKGGDLAKLKSLDVTDARIDVKDQSVRIGKIALRSPSGSVQRGEDGRWMVAQWLRSTPAAREPAKASKPWRVVVDDLGVDDGTVAFADDSLDKRVRLSVASLNLRMQNLALDGKKPAPLTVSARIKTGQIEPGTLTYKGTVMWDPVLVQGNLDMRNIPAHALAPYFADQLNVELLRADASFKGQVRYAAGPGGDRVDLKGDGALDDFRANSIASGEGALRVGEELLSWKSLTVPGVQLAMAPGVATRLTVREAAWTDFFARVVVYENGRLNLQDVVKDRNAPAAATPDLDAIVQIGPISLVNGKVLFSDRFIKPNYSADLSELTGKLSQFSSVPIGGVMQLADVDVRGRAEGTASLEITGKVNPLARPVALNIHGRVRDLELPPLSPYAIKYAGYGIDRGKLSVDVNYAILPDGQLTATNNIVLNQLMFGDKVEGAPNSLPVKLAVALLADRNGVIDINLPVSGSINDPQFKLGPVVFKLITNLIVKAITAPFSLLASASGGGGDELGTVPFAAGSSVLSADARVGLDKVAKALADRPALKMTVTGTASLEAEREAVKRERLGALLMAEKRRRSVVAGQDGAETQAVTDVEYPDLLKAVYRRADITKPRNLVGLTKDISVVEMESLLMTSMGVTEDDLRALALQRGVVVKDYLAARQLPAERLFLGGVKVVTPQNGWKPQAELSLTAN
jgi:hypothetical protein